MLATLLNFGGGALIKLATSAFSQWWDFKRHKEMAIINQQKDTIIALQSGTDRADKATRATRNILAFLLVGSWIFINVWVILHPDIKFDVFVGKHQSWIWELLWPFPANDKGIATISAGEMIFATKGMMEILIGFYFTKVGR